MDTTHIDVSSPQEDRLLHGIINLINAGGYTADEFAQLYIVFIAGSWYDGGFGIASRSDAVFWEALEDIAKTNLAFATEVYLKIARHPQALIRYEARVVHPVQGLGSEDVEEAIWTELVFDSNALVRAAVRNSLAGWIIEGDMRPDESAQRALTPIVQAVLDADKAEHPQLHGALSAKEKLRILTAPPIEA